MNRSCNYARFWWIASLFIASLVLLGSASAVFAQDVGTPESVSQIGFWTSVGTGIGNFILYIGAYITGFGGLLLEASIKWFILDINGLIGKGAPLGNSIENIWVLIRDICNLAFIFGFIYVGIRTIIDADNSNTKRMISSIIIGALLINFSLFFAKVIIDVSNYVSVEIYNNLVNTSNGGSISTNFRDILGVRSIYDMPDPSVFTNMTTGGNIAYYFMATLMLIVAGFVLAAGAVLLMIRFVALVLILCFSPVLFAATVFPATQEYAGRLWRQLFSYSFFAPVYLLLLIVSIKVLSGVVEAMRPQDTGGTLSNALAINPTTGTVTDLFGVVLSFGVGIFFLIMSLQIAQKFGIAGADRTIAFGNALRGRGQRFLGNAVGGATFGAAGSLGRNFIGRGATRFSESNNLKTASSRRGLKGFAARQVMKGSKSLADSSFDARNVAGLGEKLGVGSGAKAGYKTNLDKKIEKTTTEAKAFVKELGYDEKKVAEIEKAGKVRVEEAKVIVEKERKELDSKTKEHRMKLIAKTREAATTRDEQRRGVIRAEIEQMRVENESVVSEYREKIKKAEEEMKKIQKEIAENVATQKGERAVAYAENLQNSIFKGWFQDNQKAAEAIRKDVESGKKEAAKAIDDTYVEKKS